MGVAYPSFNLLGQSTAYAGKTFSVSGASIVIGRGSDSSLRLDDAEVSRHHVRISFDGGQWVVEDLGSTNGTFINGKRLTAPCVLRSGDVLGIGIHTFSFQASAAPADAYTLPAAMPAAPAASRGGHSLAWATMGGMAAVLVVLVALALGIGGYLYFNANKGASSAASGNNNQVAFIGNPSTITPKVGEVVNFQFSVRDPSGIVRTELWVDGVAVETTENPSPTPDVLLISGHNWTPASAGMHSVVIKTINRAGAVLQSQPVMVNVQESSTPTSTATMTIVTATPAEVLPPTAEPLPTATTITNATATAVVTPTATVAPAATPTSQPANVSASAVAGVFNDFEKETPWKRGDEANGTLAMSTAQSHSPTHSGKLDYVFKTSGNDYVVFMWSQLLAGQPNMLQAWVFGDNSGHYLNAWVRDNDGEVWQFSFGKIKHTGWGQMTAFIDTSSAWPAGHISGPQNGSIDYPIRFAALVLDDAPDSYVGNGTIYVDDLSSGTGTPATATPTATSTAAAAPTSTKTPTPDNSEPSISFSADDTTIDLGECTKLRWNVQHVKEVYLDGDGVTGEGSKKVCPEFTRTYDLRVVLNNGSETDRHVTIEVYETY
jgi:hypothetical protein